MDVNAGGSITLSFGPTAPEGKEANWLATMPSKGRFGIFRVYGLQESWFEHRWKLLRFRSFDPLAATSLNIRVNQHPMALIRG